MLTQPAWNLTGSGEQSDPEDADLSSFKVSDAEGGSKRSDAPHVISIVVRDGRRAYRADLPGATTFEAGP